MMTDHAALRAAILKALAMGPTTWPGLQERAGETMDPIAAGYVLNALRDEGLVTWESRRGEWSIYRLL